MDTRHLREWMLLCETVHLLESRLDALRQKFLPQIEKALAWLKNVPVDKSNTQQAASAVFDMVAEADPDPQKKNTQWLLTLTVKGTLPLEDLYKATEYLTIFLKLKNVIPVEQRNIMTYKSLQDLYAVVKTAMDKPAPITKGEEKRNIKAEMLKQAHMVMNTSDYSILIPLTKEASCYFGINTQWCTAATSSYNAFDSYNKEGPIYIILEKKTNTRWQFHFNSGQFMDEKDRSIDVSRFADKHPQVAMALVDDIIKRNPEQFEPTSNGYIVRKWSDMGDCIDDIGTEDGKSYYEHYIKDDDWVSSDFYPSYDDDNAKDLLSYLKKKDPELLTELGQWLHDQHKEDIEDIFGSDYDPSSIDDIIQLDYEVQDDDFRSCVKRAVASGSEAGAQNEAVKLFKKAINKNPHLMFLVKGELKGEFEWDVPVAFVISKEEFAHHLDAFEDNNISEMAENMRAQIDIQEPHYGFSDYDHEAAEERFVDEVYELVS